MVRLNYHANNNAIKPETLSGKLELRTAVQSLGGALKGWRKEHSGQMARKNEEKRGAQLGIPETQPIRMRRVRSDGLSSTPGTHRGRRDLCLRLS